MAVTISISRSVDADDELSDAEWEEFSDLVTAAGRSQLGATAVFKGFGVGEFTSEEGTPLREESYTVVFDADIIDEGLRHLLGALARRYGQQSIAVTVGETELIGPA